MPHPRYADLAARIGIPYCRGIRPNGRRCYSGHENGSVGDDLVHWRDRRPTNAGIYRFLYLAATLRHADEPTTWRRLYLALRDVPHLAAAGQVRLPHRLGNSGRARLRAMLLRVPITEPLREEAMSWANR
jgi:hypothetical protein